MANLFKMIKDAAGMQRNMKKLQAELRAKTVEFSRGPVRVAARGDASIASIRIEPAALDPQRAAALESQLVAAVEGALDAAKKLSAEVMQKAMAGMNLPGLS